MDQPLVNLRVDFAFKQLFGSRGNEQILMQFLNVILASSLSSPIQTLQIEDPHLHREYEKDKLSLLDVLATLDDNTQTSIEIQLNDQHDFLTNYPKEFSFLKRVQGDSPTIGGR